MKFVISLAALAATLLCSTPVLGQAALDGFDPNANGTIRVVVVQPDGKILIGGSFTTLSPNGGATVTRNCMARLNSNGTVDTAFDPNANGEVRAIVVQPDGKILVGGSFNAFNGANSIGGQPRNRIARLDATTGQADSFNPNAYDNTVAAIALQADGMILVGGNFQNIGGQLRSGMARLDPTTGAADSFNPDPFPGSILAIRVQADGMILVGGFFTGIGGQPRSRIGRLNPGTGAADSFDPKASEGGTVRAIVVQPNGKVLIGGDFTTLSPNGGAAVTRNRIARLNADGTLDTAFNPNANTSVISIALQADGRILAGGEFAIFGGQPSIGGQMRNYLARLDATAGQADSFNPNPNSVIQSLAVQGDGKILAAGNFNFIVGQTRSRIARLMTDSLFRVLAAAHSGNEFLVSFTAVEGSTYRLERKADLTGSNWDGIDGIDDVTADATGSCQITDSSVIGLDQAFYRVRLLP